MNKKIHLLTSALLCTLSAQATTHYPAQIVGRDLDEPYIHWFGHVGITIANKTDEPTENIIEVLPSMNVIQINPLSDFKQRSRYWGSRYGIADHDASTQKIVDEALKQRALCPVYTLSDTYHIGLGTPDNPIRCAVFRCDTFVNHIFHTAGHDLPTYNGITLPLRVFYAFPKANHDYHQNIQDLSFDKFKQEVDLPQNQTTPESIHHLWKLVKNPYLPHNKRIFLLDYLGLNGTPDLIDAFIDYYQEQTHPDIKNMLIRSTFTLYQTHFLNRPHKHLQKFYHSLLNQPLNTEAIPFVIRGFVTLSSAKEVLLSQYQINQQLTYHAQKLPPENQISLNLLLAFKNASLEKYYLSRIIWLLIKENNPHLNQLFEQAIISRVERLGIHALTPESKRFIQEKQLPASNGTIF